MNTLITETMKNAELIDLEEIIEQHPTIDINSGHIQSIGETLGLSLPNADSEAAHIENTDGLKREKLQFLIEKISEAEAKALTATEALYEINEAALFTLDGCSTVVDFAQMHWGYKKTRTYQMLRFGRLLKEHFRKSPDKPTIEYQARALASLLDCPTHSAKIPEIWQEAKKAAGAGKITAGIIQEAKYRIVGKAPKTRKKSASNAANQTRNTNSKTIEASPADHGITGVNQYRFAACESNPSMDSDSEAASNRYEEPIQVSNGRLRQLLTQNPQLSPIIEGRWTIQKCDQGKMSQGTFADTSNLIRIVMNALDTSYNHTSTHDPDHSACCSQFFRLLGESIA